MQIIVIPITIVFSVEEIPVTVFCTPLTVFFPLRLEWKVVRLKHAPWKLIDQVLNYLLQTLTWETTLIDYCACIAGLDYSCWCHAYVPHTHCCLSSHTVVNFMTACSLHKCFLSVYTVSDITVISAHLPQEELQPWELYFWKVER